MKIGIDARLWNETGVGRYIRMLYRYLPEIDKENEYVWFLGKKEFETLKMPSPKFKKVLADVHWHTFREQLLLPFIYSREKLDLLHFPYFTFPIFYPGKFVVTIHDLILDHYKTGKTSTLPGWLYLIKKASYHIVQWVATFRARKILTLTNDARKEIHEHYLVPEKKIVPIYESGKLEDGRTDFPDKKFQEIINLKPYILYVGNAHPHKNVESLIRAIRIIRNDRDFKDLKLVLIGNDGFFYPRLGKWVKEEGLSEGVVIVGEVPNHQIAAWYHFATAFVSASRMEGFGIPPLEAMSVGCPVIVSDIGVFHEVNGEAAGYFNHEDPQDIAKRVIEVIRDDKKIKDMISRGYKKANSYSWERCARETYEVYESSISLRSDQ